MYAKIQNKNQSFFKMSIQFNPTNFTSGKYLTNKSALNKFVSVNKLDTLSTSGFGKIPYFDSSQRLTCGNIQVGVGTSNPNARLIVIGKSTFTGTMSLGAGSLSDINGWTILPGGLQMVWGTSEYFPTSNPTWVYGTISFSRAFSAVPYSIVATTSNTIYSDSLIASGAICIIGCDNYTANNFRMRLDSNVGQAFSSNFGPIQIRWIAIGPA